MSLCVPIFFISRHNVIAEIKVHSPTILTIPDRSRYNRLIMKKTNPDFLNGVPELLILKLLDRRPMHGYDLVQAIREGSAMKLDFGEGSIYPVLHRLEEQKLLSSKKEMVGGRNRIIYRLTNVGERKLEASYASWKQMIEAVNSVMEGMQGGIHGAPEMA